MFLGTCQRLVPRLRTLVLVTVARTMDSRGRWLSSLCQVCSSLMLATSLFTCCCADEPSPLAKPSGQASAFGHERKGSRSSRGTGSAVSTPSSSQSSPKTLGKPDRDVKGRDRVERPKRDTATPQSDGGSAAGEGDKDGDEGDKEDGASPRAEGEPAKQGDADAFQVVTSKRQARRSKKSKEGEVPVGYAVS